MRAKIANLEKRHQKNVMASREIVTRQGDFRFDIILLPREVAWLMIWPDLTTLQWTFALLAAIGVGLSKAGFGGVGIISVVLMAQVLPPRESTGAILPLLIFADMGAVLVYRKFAIWSHLVRLLPPAFLGIVCGWLIMPHLDSRAFGHFLGALVIVLVAVGILQRCVGAWPERVAEHPGMAWSMGWLAGLTTMLANAAGAVMTIYLLACRLPKYEFVGTAAWFFFIVNVVKVPFSASLGLINPQSLTLNVLLLPSVVLGLLVGRFCLTKINQTAFEWLMLAFSLVGGLKLLLG